VVSEITQGVSVLANDCVSLFAVKLVNNCIEISRVTELVDMTLLTSGERYDI